MASIALVVAAFGLASALGSEPLSVEMDGHGLMRREALASVYGHDHKLPPGITVEAEPTTAAATTAAPAAEENATATAPAPVVLGPVNSTAYQEAITASDPVGYWSFGSVSDGKVHALGRACGMEHGMDFGDPCVIDALVLGAPTETDSLIPSNIVNKAMHFSGESDEEVKIPDHHFINTDEVGYDKRTVELWFSSESPGDISRVIYCEGNEVHSGMSMYVKETDGALKLNFYAWDRGNHEAEFGTPLINKDPINCTIQPDTPYYVALEFNAPNESFTGYIKGPDSGAEMQVCGQMDNVPLHVMLHHHGHGGGNAVIGGIHTSSRGDGTDQGKMLGQEHNFKGSIDEVAIYNRIVPVDELMTHWTASRRTRG